MERAELSRHSSVSLRTIRRAEFTERETTLTAANDLAVRHAFETAGVEFIDENGGGPGVRATETATKERLVEAQDEPAPTGPLSPRSGLTRSIVGPATKLTVASFRPEDRRSARIHARYRSLQCGLTQAHAQR
jgi:hypothetical protein